MTPAHRIMNYAYVMFFCLYIVSHMQFTVCLLVLLVGNVQVVKAEVNCVIWLPYLVLVVVFVAVL